MNRKAFISGSASGIGREIATHFATKGIQIAAHGLEKEDPVFIEKLSQLSGKKCRYFQVDLRDRVQTEEMLQTLLEAWNGLDILVNCAGTQHVAPIEDFSDEKWDAILETNLGAAFRLSRGCWRSMKNVGWGRIVNIASVHGLRASPFKSAYVSAKHGLLGLTKTLALEGADFGITVNALCPGYVQTPLVEKQIRDQARVHQLSEEEVVSKVLLKRHAIKNFVKMESIAELAFFICSDAASEITGAAFNLDAGWSAY